MNHAYMRPGGVAQDCRRRRSPKIREFLDLDARAHRHVRGPAVGQHDLAERTQGVAVLDVTGCLALGITGPVLRSAGLGWDIRKQQPYCGYETYDFEVPTTTDRATRWGRYKVRLNEMRQSVRIVQQAMDRLSPARS